jgi:hypothetical protein
MADVDQALAHVLKDLAVPNGDGVEQKQTIAALDASRAMALVTAKADVDQTLAHVPKDPAVLKLDPAE